MIGVRLADPTDADVVAELRTLARAALGDARGADQFLAAEGVTEHASPVVVLGTIDGDPVGIATLVLDGRRALLSELFTHPRARGVGVGHAMLAEAQRLAHEQGCTELDSFALPGDRDTKNFFESHAMKSRLLVVHTSLGAAE